MLSSALSSDLSSLTVLHAESCGSARKQFLEGTHRVVDPATTLHLVAPFMREMGITRVANVTGLDYIGLPVFAAYRPDARSLTATQGKGATPLSAKVSAIMEAIEAFHGEYVIQPLQCATLKDLLTEGHVADVDRLPKARKSRFTSEFPIVWIEGYDLLQNNGVWVPYEPVHCDYRCPLPEASGCFLATTNGLASGNCYLEAISHGICEVIERDAISMASVEDPFPYFISFPTVELNTVEDSVCRAALDLFAAAQVSVTVRDITSDIGVPCFFCTICGSPDAPERYCPEAHGSGCHPTPEIALFRALSEAAQSRLTLIAGARDDITFEHYRGDWGGAVPEWLKNEARFGEQKRSFQEVYGHVCDSIAGDVAWELEQLRRIGTREVIVIDLGNPRFGVPVVRVLIPGLEGMNQSPAYRPGARAIAKFKAG